MLQAFHRSGVDRLVPDSFRRMKRWVIYRILLSRYPFIVIFLTDREKVPNELKWWLNFRPQIMQDNRKNCSVAEHGTEKIWLFSMQSRWAFMCTKNSKFAEKTRCISSKRNEEEGWRPHSNEELLVWCTSNISFSRSVISAIRMESAVPSIVIERSIPWVHRLLLIKCISRRCSKRKNSMRNSVVLHEATTNNPCAPLSVNIAITRKY